MTGDKEEDEVQEVRLVSKDRAKKKAWTSSIPSTSSTADNDETLARLSVTEYASQTEPFMSMKQSDRDTFLVINKQEMEMQQKKLEIKQQMLNQYLLMTISELKVKLIFVEKGKNVDTKFDRFSVLRKLIYVRPMNKNKDLKSKIVPKIKVRKDLSKPVTSCSLLKIEQVKSNTNVIARGMYRVVKIGTQIPIAKPNMLSSNSTRVESSSSISRPESKSTNLKKSVFLNTKSKSTSKEFKKHQNSVQVIQLVLWIVNSGCSKHMTGNLKLLRNFVDKFIGTIRFENDHLQQSHDTEIMFRETSRYITSTMLRALDTTFSWLDNFAMGILNKKDLVDGLPKFKYDKDHLCPTCEQGKSKKAILKTKLVPCTHSKLEMIHMDSWGPMRVESINGKRYLLLIVNDYSRYTWVYFLRTKDEASEMIIKFIT
ncbi:retrovirus-related pol polyprotein from transposon TNT 1-94 [Tanacetum coccineum]|uniref:Retrovirus-related pol polyprotein from transposon TNT 1-94 n=1 Tax=Tanacetum coccineum TaxID=301880 RepID=A0ABQ5HZJ1_9ASTR